MAGVFSRKDYLPLEEENAAVFALLSRHAPNNIIFLCLVLKNKRDNVTMTELKALQALAIELLSLTKQQLTKAVEDGAIQEIIHDTENKKRDS